jgi:hypothetical protein
MKARGRLAILWCALIALLGLPGGANGAAIDGAEIRVSIFEVGGSDGYEVVVSSWREGDTPGDAVVQAVNDPFQSIYSVPANAAPGVHATFGSLGQVDVSFEQRRKEIDRPSKGCRSITEEGVFRGTFRFVGENGYFSSEAVDPEGEIWRLPDGFCVFEEFRRARPAIPGFRKTALAAVGTEGKRTVSFQATRLHLEQETLFTGSLRERVGQMRVERSATVSGGKETFLSSKRSRASVRPPWPFDGSARFRDPARRPASWTGSLSVPLPGVPPVALTGSDFTAKLCPGVSILSRCLRGTPGLLRYGSGSHSQPLALARLSSLR